MMCLSNRYQKLDHGQTRPPPSLRWSRWPSLRSSHESSLSIQICSSHTIYPMSAVPNRRTIAI